MNTSKSLASNVKSIFSEKGNCAPAMFHIINEKFENNHELEEKAARVFAGGVALLGHQCGLLWGAALGVSAQAYGKSLDSEKTIGIAIKTSQRLANSFKKITYNINCKTITETDLSKETNITPFLKREKSEKCFDIAELWTPEAIRIAEDSLTQCMKDIPDSCRSCATRVVREMGGDEKDALMVSGLAGGLGLSGNSCGAMGAALWFKALKWLRENPSEKEYPLPKAQEQIKKYLTYTGGEFLCPTLSGHRFRTVEQHCTFIAEGGCNKWINILAEN